MFMRSPGKNRLKIKIAFIKQQKFMLNKKELKLLFYLKLKIRSLFLSLAFRLKKNVSNRDAQIKPDLICLKQWLLRYGCLLRDISRSHTPVLGVFSQGKSENKFLEIQD